MQKELVKRAVSQRNVFQSIHTDMEELNLFMRPQLEDKRLMRYRIPLDFRRIQINPSLLSPLSQADYQLFPWFVHVYFFNNHHKFDDYLKWSINQTKNLLKKFSNMPTIMLLTGDTPNLAEQFEDQIVFEVSSNNGGHIMPYFVDPPKNNKPISEAKWDISFQGSLKTNPVRKCIRQCLDQCRVNGFDCYFKDTGDHFDLLDSRKQKHLKQSYIESIEDSKFVLCPRGPATNSVRFYEVLSRGRIPVLIADTDLPLENQIDYSKFCVMVPEEKRFRMCQYITEFSKKRDLHEASVIARNVHETYFTSISEFLNRALDKPKSAARIGLI